MQRKYWKILFIMAMLSPLGLLSQGTAWGEWGAEDLVEMIGYIPQGIGHAGTWWQAFFPEYGIPFLGEEKLVKGIGYVIAALLGSGMIYGMVIFYTRLLGRRGVKTYD
jgi:cobalt/nickel transport protein